MAEITQVGGAPVIDYTARDYTSLLQAMRAMIPSKLPEWQDFTNEADFGNVLLELFAHLGDILSYYQDRVANESFLGTARTRRAVIQHLRLIGYELSTAAPAAASLTLSVPATVTDVVTLSKGDAFATTSQKDRPSVRFEYTSDAPLTIDFGAVQPDPGTQVKTYRGTAGIPVEEGRLITDEVLGVSDGAHNQHFTLARPGVILRRSGPPPQLARDLVVVSRLGTVTDGWTRVESLAFSQGDQRDYIVEVDEHDRATVTFGDGVLGAVPVVGAQILASYRVGGGRSGNVPAGAITTILNAPQLAVLGASVSNPEPATGGADQEDTAHAVRHAPAVFRSMRRAVTAADYEALALSFEGVAKVRAVAAGWNQVTLLVAPEGGGKVSDVLEAGLKGFLEDKRMLSQSVEIEDVDYIPVMVTARIGVQGFYVTADVVDQVRLAVAGLLDFDRVDFGQILHLSRFSEAIQNVPGVVFVDIVEFRRADRPVPAVAPLGTIRLEPNEIPVPPTDTAHAGSVQVVVDNGGR